MAHVCFHRRKWVHTRLSEKDRTQGLTRRNRGHFGWGWYHYSRSVLHVHQHPRAGYQNGKLCRFWVLPETLLKNAESLMRVAVPRRRGPAGLRDPFSSVEIVACMPCAQGLSACARRGVVSLPSACFACCRNAGRPLVKMVYLPFSEVDGHCSPRDAYFLANIQVSLSVISVANAFALWYDKSHKSGLFGDEGEPE